MSRTHRANQRAAWLAALLILFSPASAGAYTLLGLVNTGELFASTNGGVDWTTRATLPLHDAVALVAGATSSKLLLASAGGSVHASEDGGASWIAVSAVAAQDVVALVGFQGQYLLLTRSGGVYRSADFGATWVTAGAVASSDLVSAVHAGHTWFALSRSGETYRSGDGGSTWTAIGAIATSEATAITPYNGKLYVISASGDLYESGDEGETFLAVSSLSQTRVAAMVSTPAGLLSCLRTGEVAATTDGVSWTWRGAINQLAVRALATDLPTSAGIGPSADTADAFGLPWPNPADGPVRLSFSLDHEERAIVAVYDVTGRQVSAVLNRQSLSAGTTLHVWRPHGLVPGLYFIRCSTPGRDTVRRLVWLGGE